MSDIRPSNRLLAAATAIIVLASAGGGAAAIAAGSGPRVRTSRGCYMVGQRVTVTGRGFAAGRLYDISIDGVDFGQSFTDGAGAFKTSLVPGGLAAGQPQGVDTLDADDGTSDASATFTVTRKQGGLFLASHGNPRKLRAPFEVFGFSLNGKPKPIYLHYVAPSGRVRTTLSLGNTGGQCGFLRTPKRHFFPFSPSVGQWTLQLDTHRVYASQPQGPVARIVVQVH